MGASVKHQAPVTMSKPLVSTGYESDTIHTVTKPCVLKQAHCNVKVVPLHVMEACIQGSKGIAPHTLLPSAPDGGE